jgi:hypothetical protein
MAVTLSAKRVQRKKRLSISSLAEELGRNRGTVNAGGRVVPDIRC